MASTGNRNNKRVVNTRRSASGGKSGYTPVAKRNAKPKRRKPTRRNPQRKGLIGMVTGLFAWIFRLIWRLFWRGAVVMALISGVTIWYFHSTLPELETLLDARTRGSVTLLDRDGKVFA